MNKKNNARCNVIHLMMIAAKKGTKKAAREAIAAYERFKDEYNCVGPMEFNWAEMKLIDKVFENV